MALGLAASLLSAAPALAAPYHPGHAQKETPVAGRSVKPSPTSAPTIAQPFRGTAPVWPAATTVDVDLAAASGARGLGAGQRASAVRATGTPVWLTAAERPMATAERPTATAGARKVTVRTLDHAAGTAAGVDGLVFALSGDSGPLDIAVDYSAFRWAGGADWAQRLRLVELPDCALTTPTADGCQGRPVPFRADTAAATVSATVTGARLLGLTTGTGGGAGDYAATPLSPSALWSAGSNTGGFSWAYPMRTPPSLGGPAPQLKLAYSSAAVDGKMAASNNQPGWVGEGFDLDPGFIERRYRPCVEDRGTGANNPDTGGDQCWATDNATLSFGGHGGELIKDPTVADRWRTRSDDGTLVEHRTGAANGARNGEYWLVTTTDGTQYWFGQSAAGTLTMPVAGNHADEPCHATAFADSFCVQAWQWHLDRVVDTHGNTMSYVYAKETNKYAKNNRTTDLVSYDRAGYLTRIDYGTRTDRTETAPMQVVFDTADRCLAACATHDAGHWPDVPWDTECVTSPCTMLSPTFWSTKRLVKVTTRVAGNPVEEWTLTQSFPDPGDGTRAGLWLERISHKGLVRGTAPMPDVVFEGVQLSNRVDTYDDQYAAMKWWRLRTITLETGGRISVTYSAADCVPGARMPDPAALQDNKLRCYPVRWKPEGNDDAIVDFFHKYVVTDITETDLPASGGAPRTLTHYDYVGDPAWHYTDDDGLIKAENKTWSMWRGYAAVRTVKGDPGERTVTEARYFRGMDGDHLPTGTRDVSLPAIAVGGVPKATDADAFAGMTRETLVFDGTAEVSATVSEPWQSPPTATRTINNSTVYARHTQVAVAHTRTALDGGRGYRTTRTASTFENTYGTVTQAEDSGDEKVAGDETCTVTSYARNTGAWLVAAPNRIEKYGVTCAKVTAGTYTATDVIGDNRMSFDQQAFGAAPTRGEVTRNEELTSLAGARGYVTTARSDFDANGRVVANYDAHDQKTATGYTPAAGGPVTGTTTTTPLLWKSTTTLDPAWGVTVATVDTNGRRSDLTYDPLGRLTAVWGPGRDKLSQSANATYTYLTRNDGPSVVTSAGLTPNGGYKRSYALYDALGRPRQSQTADESGGPNAVVADTLYDTAGRAARTNRGYLSTVAAGPNLFQPTGVIPVQNVTVFDGANRITADIVSTSAPSGGSPGATEKWRTTTSYGGDRTDRTPPAGGVVTSSLTDAAGHTVELRQYHQGVAAGTADPATFDRTTYTFDNRDLLRRVTDPAGRHWDTTYDLRGRPVHATDPDSGATDTAYADTGEVLTETDAHGTLAFTYDPVGRKRTERVGTATGTLLAEWSYDTLTSGTVVRGQLAKTTRYAGGRAYSTEVTGYTVDYQPTGNKITIPDEETGLAGVYTYAYTYKQDGSPATTRLPATGDLKLETLTYGYDLLGHQATVRDGYGTNPETDLVTGTGFTAFGEVGSFQLANNAGKTVDVTRTYDTDTRRLAQIWTSRQTGPTTISDVRFSYDPAGNTTRIADLTSGDTQCFRTDHLRRLAEAWTPGGSDCAPEPAAGGGPAPYWQSYRYDTAGNRTTLVEHATSAGDRTTTSAVDPGRHLVTGTATTDAAGTRTAGYTYTDAGDTWTRPTAAAGTQTLTWDLEGHLSTAKDTTGTTSYVYDGDGKRLIRVDPTGKTLYLPGQELRFTTAGSTTAAVRYYRHADGTVAMRTGAGITWLSADEHGTASVSVNAVSQAFAVRRQTPFGVSRGTTGTWVPQYDKGFLGGTSDNTGLTNLGSREYDPGTGRFISRDPVLRNDDPQQVNGYAYANNNPVTFTDPTGLDWLDSLSDAASDFVDTATDVIERTDAPMFALGLGMTLLGGMTDTLGGALCATGVGAPLGAVVLAGGIYVTSAGVAIAVTAVAAPNIAYAVRNNDSGGGGGESDDPDSAATPREYEEEIRMLMKDHDNKGGGALTEENAIESLQGPPGTKPNVTEDGLKGGADIEFTDADGNVVLRREVKTTGNVNGYSSFNSHIKEANLQFDKDGEIFYQVKDGADVENWIQRWQGSRRGVDDYTKVKVRFRTESGKDLGTYNLGIKGKAGYTPPKPQPKPEPPRQQGGCRRYPGEC
ncbi:RHS repeat-associated core domain-containing protein [Longispora sp. K20-0274]|uniref:RHS repeat-associated core domain-containing protein n=1 Tax=Longispora sp. K20-0274 TaxID=3088255 RepID=UPI00399A5CA0